MLAAINNLDNVNLFFKQLIEEGTNTHPDDDFNDYINLETGKPTYSVTEAALRNKLMSRCFDICESSEVDIYDLMQEIYLTETGLDKLIPLPPKP